MLEQLYCEVSVIVDVCDDMMLELRKVRGRLLKWIMKLRVIDAKKIGYKEEKGNLQIGNKSKTVQIEAG
jgi:hypothetical protein